MKDGNDPVVYEVGIVLSKVVDIIYDMFTVLTEQVGTISSRKSAYIKLEQCISELNNLKKYLKNTY